MPKKGGIGVKAFQIRRLGVGSIFRFYLCAGFVVGLIACIVLLILGYSLKNLGLELGTLKGALGVSAGIVGAILASVVCGLAAGASGAVVAFLYNLFASAVGGIVVKLEDL